MSYSDLALIASLGAGVGISFIIDPLVSYVRTEVGKKTPSDTTTLKSMSKFAIPSWMSRYRGDIGLGVAILILSYIIAIIVYAFGLRPADPWGAIETGFLWNTTIDKVTGKKVFSSAKQTVSQGQQ